MFSVKLFNGLSSVTSACPGDRAFSSLSLDRKDLAPWSFDFATRCAQVSQRAGSGPGHRCIPCSAQQLQANSASSGPDSPGGPVWTLPVSVDGSCPSHKSWHHAGSLFLTVHSPSINKPCQVHLQNVPRNTPLLSRRPFLSLSLSHFFSLLSISISISSCGFISSKGLCTFWNYLVYLFPYVFILSPPPMNVSSKNTRTLSCSHMDRWRNKGTREPVFLKNGQKAWLLAPENGKWEFCSAFTLTLCLCFSVSVPLGPCPNSHTPECALPRSPFRSYGLSFKMLWHTQRQGSVAKPPYVSAYLLLWLLWSLLNCFVLTGLSHLETYCWLKTYARLFFLLFFLYFNF